MKVYFDTNVYRFIAATGHVARVASLLRSRGAGLIASSDNLFETYAIADAVDCKRALKVLTRLATSFQSVPNSYLDAAEVRRAIAHHRPRWITRVPFNRRARQLLKDHKDRWRDALHGQLPDADAYAAYRRDLDRGVADSVAMVKKIRAAKLSEQQATVVTTLGEQFLATDLPLDDPEKFWRIEAWLAYKGALIHRNPATRDLADWLSPYLRVDLIDARELLLFWLQEVQREEVPRSRWAGLVAHGQLASKVSHGNPADQQHAVHAIDTDLFVTADRGLFEAMSLARSSYAGPLAKLALLDRGNPSALLEIERTLT